MKKRRIQYEVLPNGDGLWKITRDRVVVGYFERKAEAVSEAAARGRACWANGQLAQLFIKGRDGKIKDERTYGRDPRHIPG